MIFEKNIVKEQSNEAWDKVKLKGATSYPQQMNMANDEHIASTQPTSNQQLLHSHIFQYCTTNKLNVLVTLPVLRMQESPLAKT